MSLGYEVFDDERNFEQEGITGEVKKYAKGVMKYPCIILTETEENRLNLFSLQTAKEMFTKPDAIYDETYVDRIVYVYVRLLDGHLISFNSIDSSKVNAFCNLFQGHLITGKMYDENKNIIDLDADMVQVLAI